MRTRRSLLNYGTGAIYTAIVLLIGFVATPFLLRWLGEERFGAFRAASDWFGYLSLLEFGLGGALLALLAQAVGRGDARATEATLATGIRWYVRIVLVMIAAGLALASMITWLVPVSPEHTGDLRRGVLIAVLGLTLLPFSAAFKSLAEATQRSYWINVLLLVQSLTITGTALVLAWAGWGITGQFLAVLAGALLFNLPLIWTGLRRYPGILRSALRNPPDPDAQRGLRALNMPTLVYYMSGRFSFETDNIIVAFILGPVAVVPLVMTQKLIVMAQGQLTNVGNASWAALAELHFQGQHEQFNRRLIDLTSLVAIFGVAGLVPVTVYNRYFVAQWVGPQYYAGDWVTIIVTVNALLRAVVALWGWCFGGTARTPLLIKASIAETVINVSVSVVLTYHLGLAGPLIGTLAGLVCVSVWYLPRLLQSVFGTSVGELASAVAAPLFLGIPYAAGLWWIADRYPPAGWTTLGAHVIAAVLTYLLLWWSLMMNHESRRQVAHRAALVLGSKRA